MRKVKGVLWALGTRMSHKHGSLRACHTAIMDYEPARSLSRERERERECVFLSASLLGVLFSWAVFRAKASKAT